LFLILVYSTYWVSTLKEFVIRRVTSAIAKELNAMGRNLFVLTVLYISGNALIQLLVGKHQRGSRDPAKERVI